MNKLKIFLSIALILIIIIPLIISGVRKNKADEELNDDPPKNQTGSSNTESLTYEIDKIDTVYFTGKYGKVYKGVKPGTKVSSQNLTCPIRVKNKSKEISAQKGEDIFFIFGDTRDNNELSFHSTNGNMGSIEIVFWRLTKK